MSHPSNDRIAEDIAERFDHFLDRWLDYHEAELEDWEYKRIKAGHIDQGLRERITEWAWSLLKEECDE